MFGNALYNLHAALLGSFANYNWAAVFFLLMTSHIKYCCCI